MKKYEIESLEEKDGKIIITLAPKCEEAALVEEKFIADADTAILAVDAKLDELLEKVKEAEAETAPIAEAASAEAPQSEPQAPEAPKE